MSDKTPEARCCYDFMWSAEYSRGEKQKADDCPGVLAITSENGYPEDGYFIQVCPRQSSLGRVATHIDFCGNGADVIVMHQDTVPTKTEYEQAARDFDNDW